MRGRWWCSEQPNVLRCNPFFIIRAAPAVSISIRLQGCVALPHPRAGLHQLGPGTPPARAASSPDCSLVPIRAFVSPAGVAFRWMGKRIGRGNEPQSTQGKGASMLLNKNRWIALVAGAILVLGLPALASAAPRPLPQPVRRVPIVNPVRPVPVVNPVRPVPVVNLFDPCRAGTGSIGIRTCSTRPTATGPTLTRIPRGAIPLPGVLPGLRPARGPALSGRFEPTEERRGKGRSNQRPRARRDYPGGLVFVTDPFRKGAGSLASSPAVPLGEGLV